MIDKFKVSSSIRRRMMQVVFPVHVFDACEIDEIIACLKEKCKVKVAFVSGDHAKSELTRAQDLADDLGGLLHERIHYEFVSPTTWEFSF